MMVFSVPSQAAEVDLKGYWYTKSGAFRSSGTRKKNSANVIHYFDPFGCHGLIVTWTFQRVTQRSVASSGLFINFFVVVIK